VDSDSVICYGRARIVETVEERQALLDVFNRRFNPEGEPISQERAENCGAVEITVEEMTGRRERESGVTYWRHRFG
jgi:nitroimidazol reductase NimA-like FMN-containing flavoprotein (pyridoxamine 5'-phosphate oxidase superfamily)